MPYLTDALARDATLPSEGSTYIWDDTAKGVPGFGLRLIATGGRTWAVRYRVGPKQRIVSLGPCTALSAAKARKLAGEHVAAARLAIDKATEAEQRRAALRSDSVADAADRYIRQQQAKGRRPATLTSIRHSLGPLLAPIAKTPAPALTRQAVAAWKDGVAQARGNRTADIAANHLAAALDIAVLRGDLPANPARGVPRLDFAPPRDRVLSDEELARVWLAADPDDDYGAIVRMLILTGARRDEVGAMQATEIDREQLLWMLPAERAKTKRGRPIPLSGPAMALVRPRLARQRLFGRNAEGQGFSGWSRCKERLDAAMAAAARAEGRQPMRPWALHDLRRTVRTGLSRLGIDHWVAEAAIGHSVGNEVARIYDRHDRIPEIRVALDKWAAHVEAIVAGAGRKAAA